MGARASFLWPVFAARPARSVGHARADPAALDLAMGRMRCYHALGEWDALARLADENWIHAGHEDRQEIAPLAAAAAWSSLAAVPPDLLQGWRERVHVVDERSLNDDVVGNPRIRAEWSR